MSKLAIKLIDVLGGQNALELAKQIDKASAGATGPLETDVDAEYKKTDEYKINDHFKTNIADIRKTLGLDSRASIEVERTLTCYPGAPKYVIKVTTGNPVISSIKKDDIARLMRDHLREFVKELKPGTYDVKVEN